MLVQIQTGNQSANHTAATQVRGRGEDHLLKFKSSIRMRKKGDFCDLWNQPILLGAQRWQRVPNIVAGEFLNKVSRGFGLISDLFVQIWLEQQVEVTLRFGNVFL